MGSFFELLLEKAGGQGNWAYSVSHTPKGKEVREKCGKARASDRESRRRVGEKPKPQVLRKFKQGEDN